MTPLEILKLRIADSAANEALNRLSVRNETHAYSSQDLHTLLTEAASAAIELYNGHIQSQLHMINIDRENRVQESFLRPRLSPHDFFTPSPNFKPKD